MIRLAEEIVMGRRLSETEDLSFFETADLDSLCRGADQIRRSLCGDRADLCSIINGRGGRCSEDCRFCAQSSRSLSGCGEYGFLPEDRFLSGCAEAFRQGISRYSIVTAGRTLEGEDLEKALRAYRAMHRAVPALPLCASHGLMKKEDLIRLREAGVTRYHANLESSPRFFPEICTTHTYQDKLEEIRLAREAGLEVCSGGILGMGETWEDRICMAALLSRLNVSSIPLNFLIPVPGTPLEQVVPLSQEDMLRITALFRYLNPEAWIRIAAGRSFFPDGGSALFRAGANAVLTGDLLTTAGSSPGEDREMLESLGFSLNALPSETAGKGI